YRALLDFGVAEVWVDVPPGDAPAWVRLVPVNGVGGVVLPWEPTGREPTGWGVLPAEPAMELLLLLLALLRDCSRAGGDRVIVRDAGDKVSTETRVSSPDSKKSQRGKVALPRGRTEIIRLSPRRPALRGEYVAEDERVEIARRVADMHGVKAHLMHFRPEV